MQEGCLLPFNAFNNYKGDGYCFYVIYLILGVGINKHEKLHLLYAYRIELVCITVYVLKSNVKCL